MKKRIALLLAVFLCVSLTGCGKVTCSVAGCENEAVEDPSFEESYCSKHFADKKAFEMSKIAYENLNVAYEKVHQFASDLHTVWYIGLYEKGDVNGQFASYLSKQVNYLSDEELKVGIACAILAAEHDREWNELSAEEVNDYIEYAGSEFYVNGNVASFCIAAINHAYSTCGSIDEIKNALETAKKQLRDLSNHYSDYEHYQNLKGFYTALDSYFNSFYKDGKLPGMSFNQYCDVESEYEKEIRDYTSNLDFIFE